MIPYRLPALVAATALALAPGVASAADLIIPFTGGLQGAPGEVIALGSTAVDPSLVGRSCEVVYAGENNDSVHPGTELEIISGSSTVALQGVEDFAGKVTTGSSALVLGSSISISVKLGSDGLTSLSASLEFTCAAPPPPPPSSEETTTTTTTLPPSTSSTTTTTVVGTSSTSTTQLVAPPTPLPTVTQPMIAVEPPLPSVPPGATLPATGSSGGTNVASAAAAIGLLGGFLVLVSRRRPA